MNESTHIIHVYPLDEAQEVVAALTVLKSKGLKYSAATTHGLAGSSFLELTLELGALATGLAPSVAKVLIAWLAAREKRLVVLDGKKISLRGFTESEVVKILAAGPQSEERPTDGSRKPHKSHKK